MTPEPIWRAPQRFAPVRGAGWRLAVRVVARVEADQAANVSADLAHHLLDTIYALLKGRASL